MAGVILENRGRHLDHAAQRRRLGQTRSQGQQAATGGEGGVIAEVIRDPNGGKRAAGVQVGAVVTGPEAADLGDAGVLEVLRGYAEQRSLLFNGELVKVLVTLAGKEPRRREVPGPFRVGMQLNRLSLVAPDRFNDPPERLKTDDGGEERFDEEDGLEAM